jgi:phosphate uptake regulator
MDTRRIQFVGGSSYSVSLPKAWVLQNNLGKNSVVTVLQGSDGGLLILPQKKIEKEKKQVTLNIDRYKPGLKNILFATYYLGIDDIKLYSNSELYPTDRAKIKDALNYMIGTEVVNEDMRSIHIRSLISSSKINLFELLSRMRLLLKLSIKNVSTYQDLKELERNEQEIDRVYQLCVKTLTLSMKDPSLLQSSGLKDLKLVLPFFMVCKRIESVADYLSILLKVYSDKIKSKEKKMLDGLFVLINDATQAVLSNIELKDNYQLLKNLEKDISEMNDVMLRDTFHHLNRFIRDIIEECFNIQTYRKMG